MHRSRMLMGPSSRARWARWQGARDVDIEVFRLRGYASPDALRPRIILRAALPPMLRADMFHERITVAIYACDSALNGAEQAPIAGVVDLQALLLDMRLGQENPTVSNPARRSVNSHVVFVRFRIAKSVAFERAVATLPEIDEGVHSNRSGLDRETFLRIFTDRPRSLTEAPVIIAL